MARDIALLTNPTAGKGRGGKARGAVLERLRGAGLGVRDLSGQDACAAEIDPPFDCMIDSRARGSLASRSARYPAITGVT